MSEVRVGAVAFDFDAFDASVLLALLTGGLSMAFPILSSATATLVALGLAGWVSRIRKKGASWRDTLESRVVVACVVLVFAAALFLFFGGVLGPLRGLALATGIVPLALTERRHARVRAPDFAPQ